MFVGVIISDLYHYKLSFDNIEFNTLLKLTFAWTTHKFWRRCSRSL